MKRGVGMINLFSDEFIAGIACSKERKLCLDRRTILSVHLQLYAGDIRTPFSVSSRREIYGAYFEELVDSVAESIRRLKKTTACVSGIPKRKQRSILLCWLLSSG